MLEFTSVREILMYTADYAHDNNINVQEASEALVDSLNLGEGEQVASATYLRLVTQEFLNKRRYVGARLYSGDASLFNLFVAIDGIPGVYEVPVGSESKFVTYYPNAKVEGPYETYQVDMRRFLDRIYGDGDSKLKDHILGKDVIYEIRSLPINMHIFDKKEDK